MTLSPVERLDHLSGRRSVYNRPEFNRLMRSKHYAGRPAIISEGDSWFGYPPHGLWFKQSYNIISRIQREHHFNLLRLEAVGDEVMSMLSGGQIADLEDVLRTYGNRIKVLLFSGGGNDLVGKDILENGTEHGNIKFKPLLKTKGRTDPWGKALNKPAIKTKLDAIADKYRQLIELRNQHAPDCDIITHTYDRPIPDGRSARYLGGLIDKGPWLKPSMVKAGLTTITARKAAIDYILGGLGDRLHEIAKEPASRGRFIVVKTTGTLKRTKDHWQNELHPTKDGFKLIADKIYLEVKASLARSGVFP